VILVGLKQSIATVKLVVTGMVVNAQFVNNVHLDITNLGYHVIMQPLVSNAVQLRVVLALLLVLTIITLSVMAFVK
jgi:hypothetical protein